MGFPLKTRGSSSIVTERGRPLASLEDRSLALSSVSSITNGTADGQDITCMAAIVEACRQNDRRNELKKSSSLRGRGSERGAFYMGAGEVSKDTPSNSIPTAVLTKEKSLPAMLFSDERTDTFNKAGPASNSMDSRRLNFAQQKTRSGRLSSSLLPTVLESEQRKQSTPEPRPSSSDTFKRSPFEDSTSRQNDIVPFSTGSDPFDPFHQPEEQSTSSPENKESVFDRVNWCLTELRQSEPLNSPPTAQENVETNGTEALEHSFRSSKVTQSRAPVKENAADAFDQSFQNFSGFRDIQISADAETFSTMSSLGGFRKNEWNQTSGQNIFSTTTEKETLQQVEQFAQTSALATVFAAAESICQTADILKEGEPDRTSLRNKGKTSSPPTKTTERRPSLSGRGKEKLRPSLSLLSNDSRPSLPSEGIQCNNERQQSKIPDDTQLDKEKQTIDRRSVMRKHASEKRSLVLSQNVEEKEHRPVLNRSSRFKSLSKRRLRPQDPQVEGSGGEEANLFEYFSWSKSSLHCGEGKVGKVDEDTVVTSSTATSDSLSQESTGKDPSSNNCHLSIRSCVEEDSPVRPGVIRNLSLKFVGVSRREVKSQRAAIAKQKSVSCIDQYTSPVPPPTLMAQDRAAQEEKQLSTRPNSTQLLKMTELGARTRRSMLRRGRSEHLRREVSAVFDYGDFIGTNSLDTWSDDKGRSRK